VDDGVELAGEARLEVVARPLGLRSVDDPDRTLEQGPAQRVGRRAAGVEQEAVLAGLVEEPLVAPRQGRADEPAFRRRVPGRGRGDRAGVLLGAGDRPRVLLGVELLVLGGEPVAAQVGVRPPLQLGQLGDDAAAAGRTTLASPIDPSRPS
jgi:hypothetical protein